MHDVGTHLVEDVFTLPETTTMRERVVVAPCAGRFRSLPPDLFTTQGEWVEPGTVLGEIENGAGRVPVSSPFKGWVMGMLAIDGQPVRPGEALFWIRGC
jgi:biotin carboxyl carrier protein